MPDDCWEHVSKPARRVVDRVASRGARTPAHDAIAKCHAECGRLEQLCERLEWENQNFRTLIADQQQRIDRLSHDLVDAMRAEANRAQRVAQRREQSVLVINGSKSGRGCLSR